MRNFTQGKSVLLTLDHITKRIPQEKKRHLLWPHASQGHCSMAISAHCYNYKVVTSLTLPRVITLKVTGSKETSKADPTKTDIKLAVD